MKIISRILCVVLFALMFFSFNVITQEKGKSLIELYTRDQINRMRHPRHKNLDERVNLIKYSSETLKNLSLPSSFDWRDQNIMTPVKDQMYCGGCWAFAAVGMFESLIKKSTYSNVDLAEQQVIDCDSGSCEEGGEPTEAVAYMQKSGVVLEQYYPLTWYDKNCSVSRASDYYISDWGEIDVWYEDVPKETRVLAIKNAIYTYGPVVVSMEWNDAFDYYDGGVFYYDGPLGDVNHSVVLVGWKDDASIPTGGYWIMRNSYSDQWAENGYGRIAYDTVYIDGCECIWAVYQGNDNPPVFNTIFDTQTFHEGEEIALSFAAQDPDGNTLSYTISSLPAGSAFSNTNGTFTWTPNFTQSGTYGLTVAVSDGKNVIMQTFTLIIRNAKVIHK
jgi:C1A family cysteine protease